MPVSELHFTLDSDLLTWDDWIALEEIGETAQGKTRALRDLLARFLVDEDGQKMEESRARQVLGRLKLSEITAAMEALVAAQKRVITDAIPPAVPGN